jgi:energy-coupling factor transporter ATP-binding protein EcfA2
MTAVDPHSRAAGDNPFVGLRAFGVADAGVFFGREAQVAKLLVRLRDTRFLATVGASGCGKSSLVLAGLIPALQRGAIEHAGDAWRIATMRPGAAPLEALASVLARTQVLGQRAADPNVARETILQGLRRDELGLVDLVYQARLRPDENLLIVVDQFEELFRYADAADHASEAAAFVKLLLTAASWRDLPIYVAITMRSDFIGDCARFRDLSEAVNDGVFLVPRLTRDEMQRAIEEPVLRAGERIAPQLVARLLDDVRSDADQLPVLEHALMRTWDAWENDHAAGEPLDVRHYETIGAMRGALSEHANELYDGLDTALQQIAERLFRALTARDAENRGIRRPTSLSAACAITAAQPGDIERLVRIYAAPGVSFLTASGPLSNPKAVLDIAHESLMRLWDRLRAWVDDEAESAKTYRKLVADATTKRAHWIDPELAVGEAWLAKNRASINPAWAARYDDVLEDLPADESTESPAARERFTAALAFLNASAAAPRRSVRTLIALVGIFVLIAAALAIAGFAKNSAAVAERHRAEELNKIAIASQNAKAAEIRRLDAEIATSNRSKKRADAEIARAKLETEAANKRALAAQQLAKKDADRSPRPTAQKTAAPASPSPAATASATPKPATPSPRPTARSSPAGATAAPAPVRSTAGTAASPRRNGNKNANADWCTRAVEQQRLAADATITRQTSYDAAVAGLAENAKCDDTPAKIVNEGYLRSTLAAAEHELGVGNWKADLDRANQLLARCQTMPELKATKAAADCLTQRRFNERAAAEFSLPSPAPTTR